MLFLLRQVKSEKLLCNVGLRTEVCLDDVFLVLQVWRRSETPFMARYDVIFFVFVTLHFYFVPHGLTWFI